MGRRTPLAERLRKRSRPYAVCFLAAGLIAFLMSVSVHGDIVLNHMNEPRARERTRVIVNKTTKYLRNRMRDVSPDERARYEGLYVRTHTRTCRPYPQDSWGVTVVDGVPVFADGWDRALVIYVSPDGEVGVYSAGADGEYRTDDDIIGG